MVPAAMVGDLRRRWLPIAVAAAVAFALTRLLMAVLFTHVTATQVTASSTLTGARRTLAAHVQDRATVETYTLDNFWLLEDGKTGWLRLDLGRPTYVDRIDVLNTRNGMGNDRATQSYRIELAGEGGSTSLAGLLPAYPEWQSHPLDRPVVTSVVIHVDSWRGQGGGLNEVVIHGQAAAGLAAHVSWLLPLLFAIAAAVTWHLAGGQLRARVTGPCALLGALVVLIVVLGCRFLQFSTSVSAFEWFTLFEVKSFTTWRSTIDFFQNLLIPIPPSLALLEIVVYNLTGSIDLVIRTLYKTSIIGAYALALLLVYPNVRRMLVTAALAVIFIWGTAEVHPGNPQIYDTVFPLLAMLLFLSLERARSAANDTRAQFVWWIAAGLFASLLGVTRPFAVFLLPIVVLATWFDTRGLPRRTWWGFLLPILAICGLWHAQLLVRHGQVTMSNHTGFNLVRAWPMVTRPPLAPETFSPPFSRVNNPSHSANSSRYRSAVVDYIVNHPAEAAANVGRRVAELIEPQTTIIANRWNPNPTKLIGYRYAVRFMAMLLIISLFVDLAQWLSRRRWMSTTPAMQHQRGDRVFLWLTAGTLFFLAIGDAGEDGRFVLSVLPMLAVAPRFFSLYRLRAYGGAGTNRS